MTSHAMTKLAQDSVAPVTRPVTGKDLVDELSEEIRKQYGGRGGVKAFAADMGVNYWTFRNYLNGETKMSADLLMDSLAHLGVDPLDFFTRLRLRVEGEQQAAAESE